MRNKIKKLVESFGTNNPFIIAEKLGITVLYSELPDCTKGVCYTVEGHRIILINSSLDDCCSRSVCAHELGHALLHPDMNLRFLVNDTFFSEGKLEKEADMFAAELLIDESELFSPEHENYSRSQLATTLGVSERLLNFKLSKYY
ncbi:MAG: ImmA/IrrE family metallo-endopeptidase [Acutalibacteraceae bacterium]